MQIKTLRITWPVISFCLLIAACSGADRASISTVLDARNAAITARDIGAYSNLILPDYKSREMVQREELSLVRTPAGWKISGGL